MHDETPIYWLANIDGHHPRDPGLTPRDFARHLGKDWVIRNRLLQAKWLDVPYKMKASAEIRRSTKDAAGMLDDTQRDPGHFHDRRRVDQMIKFLDMGRVKGPGATARATLHPLTI